MAQIYSVTVTEGARDGPGVHSVSSPDTPVKRKSWVCHNYRHKDTFVPSEPETHQVKNYWDFLKIQTLTV